MRIKPEKQLLFVSELIGLLLIQLMMTVFLYWIHKIYYGNNLSFNLVGVVAFVVTIVGYTLIIKINNNKILKNILIAIPIISLLEFIAILIAVRLIGE